MFIERFIRYVQYEKRFSPHTIKAYETDLLQFQTFLTTYETTLAEATHTLVRSWVMECMEASTGAKSINRKISSLRSFYKFLQRLEIDTSLLNNLNLESIALATLNDKKNNGKKSPTP